MFAHAWARLAGRRRLVGILVGAALLITSPFLFADDEHGSALLTARPTATTGVPSTTGTPSSPATQPGATTSPGGSTTLPSSPVPSTSVSGAEPSSPAPSSGGSLPSAPTVTPSTRALPSSTSTRPTPTSAPPTQTTTPSPTSSREPVLVSIRVGPANLTVPAGTTAQLVATATYDDGTTEDVTSRATWTSHDPKVVSVDTAGTVTGEHAGVTNVVAALGQVAGDVSVEVTTPSGVPGTVAP